MKPSRRFSPAPCHSSTDYTYIRAMYPYLSRERTNFKSAFFLLQSASSKMHGMNPSISHLHPSRMYECTNAWRSCGFIQNVHHVHSCSQRLVPAKFQKANTGTSSFPTVRITICVEVLLVKIVRRAHPSGSSRGEGRTGSPARMGGTYHPGRRPTTPSRYLQSSLLPCALACIVHTHAGSPAQYAMSSPHITFVHGPITISFPYICGAR